MISETIDSAKNDVRLGFRTGAVHLFGSFGIVQIFGFVVTLVLVRILTPEEIGHIRLIHSVLDFLIILGDFGLAMALLKYVAEPIDQKLRKELLGQTFIGILGVSIIVSIVSFGLLFIPNLLSDNVAQQSLKYLVWLIPFITVFGIVIHWHQGLKNIKRRAKYEFWQRLILMLATIGGALWAGLNGYFIGYTVSLIGVTLLVIKTIPKEGLDLIIIKDLMAKLFRFGRYAVLTNQFQLIIITADVLMLSILLKDPSAVGIYGVMALFIRGLWILPNAIMQTALPYLSELSVNLQSIGGLYQKLIRKMFFLIFPICLALFFLAPVIIPLLFGEQYREGVAVFQILLFSLLFFSLGTVNGTILTATANVKFNFYTAVIEALINIVLNFFFIKTYGLIGAAAATSITFFVRFIINSIFTTRLLKSDKAP